MYSHDEAIESLDISLYFSLFDIINAGVVLFYGNPESYYKSYSPYRICQTGVCDGFAGGINRASLVSSAVYTFADERECESTASSVRQP